jgi:lambda repressor-like predicted transcriptional regulator
MYRLTSSFKLFTLAGLLLATAAQVQAIDASDAAKLPVKLQFTHIGEGKWRADYAFDEAVSKLNFETVGDYRLRSWKSVTPGVHFQPGDKTEAFVADQPVKAISLEISTYGSFLPKNYAPNNQFSDGGAAVYMGFFLGEAYQGGRQRDLLTHASYQGLPGETVIAPPHFADADRSLGAYAYFGPQKPQQVGAAKVIIDPALPLWVGDLILDTSGKVSRYYEKAYQRPLKRGLVVMISVADLDSSGFSMKGGATNGQITYRMAGKALAKESPRVRELVAKIVTHEMAHIWQTNVDAGGIGEEAAWIHEGGAEFMALDALQQTGIWNADQADAYKSKASEQCDKIRNGPHVYEFDYACGLQNFMKLHLDAPIIWRALIAETEKTGKVYSETMLEQVGKRLQQGK